MMWFQVAYKAYKLLWETRCIQVQGGKEEVEETGYRKKLLSSYQTTRRRNSEYCSLYH
jgi:hypothetical protein